MRGSGKEPGEGVAETSPGRALFEVGGIEIRLEYTWFFIFALVLVSLATGYFPRAHPELSTAAYWGAALASTLLLFASVLVHELSHAWVARAHGIAVPRITLFLFGGASHMVEEPDTPSTELRVAIVGPLTSFALALAFWGLHVAIEPHVPELASGMALYLAWINLALGVFNLLPGLPLDGGRVLRAAAWWRTGSLRRGTRIAANAGKGIAIGLMILGGLEIFAGALIGGLWLVLIGLFLRATAEAGYQNLVILRSLEDVSVADVSIREPVTVSPDTSLQTLVEDYLLAYGYRGYPVVRGEQAVGLVSIDALQGLDEEKRRTGTVAQVMTPRDERIEIGPEARLADALRKLADTPGGRMLVMQGDRLVGLLTKDGVARFLEIRRVLEESG